MSDIVKAGRYSPENFPTPTDIDLLKVKKVFSECMHTEVVDVAISVPNSAQPTTATTDAFCRPPVTVTAVAGYPKVSGDVVTYQFNVTTSATIVNDAGSPVVIAGGTTTPVTVSIRLPMISQAFMELEVDVFPTCLQCFVSARDNNQNVTQVTCCIGVLILFKVFQEVQLLIPTYGYGPRPPECELAGQCPPVFNPTWPPYAPQPEGGTGGCVGCGDKYKG